MAGANDLQPYVNFNIKQMKMIGSNDNCNIVARTFTNQKKPLSETIFIGKNKKTVLEQHSNTNSGDPENLINFCINAFHAFPADHYALIFWDHGTGAIDPIIHDRTATSSLFSFQKYQISKYLPFLKLINIKKTPHKGICFDDQTKHFLSEEKLIYAFLSIQNTFSNRKKLFDIIAFDACLMAMIEVVKIVAPFADFMVASQEAEPGTGWNYTHAFAPFLKGTISPKLLGIHLVNAYAKTYTATQDYTLSLLATEQIHLFESNINHVALLITEVIKQHGNDFLSAVKESRSKSKCTYFNEPSYIDIQHFYKNLLDKIQKMQKQNKNRNTTLLSIEATLIEGIILLEKIIITKKNGPYHSNAHGLSIYFPEYIMHSIYKKTSFAKNNSSWVSLLSLLLTW